ncbi:hypothetical protein FXW78_39635 [Rhodococcus opacus]|nr:hypothetical protein [Rhodococcus opacus]
MNKKLVATILVAAAAVTVTGAGIAYMMNDTKPSESAMAARPDDSHEYTDAELDAIDWRDPKYASQASITYLNKLDEFGYRNEFADGNGDNEIRDDISQRDANALAGGSIVCDKDMFTDWVQAAQWLIDYNGIKSDLAMRVAWAADTYLCKDPMYGGSSS